MHSSITTFLSNLRLTELNSPIPQTGKISVTPRWLHYCYIVRIVDRKTLPLERNFLNVTAVKMCITQTPTPC